MIERELRGAPITLTVRVDGDAWASSRTTTATAGPASSSRSAPTRASEAEVEFAVARPTTAIATSASRPTRDERQRLREPRSPTRSVALGLFARLTSSLLLATARDLGYARDEGFYFQAASSYARWFELLFNDRKHALDRARRRRLGANHEHPALIKSLFALSNLSSRSGSTSSRWRARATASRRWCWRPRALARLPLGRARRAAASPGSPRACSSRLMPRFFFHAHLACFDVPIVAMWTLSAYAYWRSLRNAAASSGPLLTGVAFGLALDTKHNSWFLPVRCVAAHARAARPMLSRASPERRSPRRRGAFGQALAAMAAHRAAGVLRAVAVDLARHARAAPGLRAFHLNHEYYNMEFLGRELLDAADAARLRVGDDGGDRADHHPRARDVRDLEKRASGLLRPPRAAKLIDFMRSARISFLALCLFVSYAAWLRSGTPSSAERSIG